MDTLRKIVSDLKRKYVMSGLPVPFNCKLTTNPISETPVEVQLRKTRGGRLIPVTDTRVDAHIDFVLEPTFSRVKTRLGLVNLSSKEWEIYVYFHTNVGKKISLEELRDNVIYRLYGSKTQNRLSTIIGTPTYYMFN